MSLFASAKGSDFEMHPEGVSVSRCYRIIDLGTQVSEYQGKTKAQRKIVVSWESPELLTKEGKPFAISKWYTLSLSEKAILRLDLQAWRGRKFTVQELERFDVSKLLGAPCMLNIVHEAKKDGSGNKAKIASIMPLKGGMIAPPAVNAPVLFSLSDFNQTVFDSLSDGLKAEIMKSPEYAEAMGNAPAPATSNGASSDDDIPF